MESKWYEQFFHGLAVELWRKAMPQEQTLDEVDFLVSVLNLQQGASILDVPCGLGRHSIELGKRGCRMTSVDLSQESLVEAKRNAAEAGVSVEWVHADMSVLDRGCVQKKFDGAFCFGNSFGYMDYNRTIDFLRGVSSCLKVGSGFVLDTGLAAESLLPNLQTRKWYKIDDMYMLSDAAYDGELSQLRTQYTFIRDGDVQTSAATYFIYTVAELKRLFAMCDLQVQNLFSTTKQEPYRYGSQRLLIVARRSL
jgi:cyclopropane fatty-acyl-phospholipid synthase-like methyltransferase